MPAKISVLSIPLNPAVPNIPLNIALIQGPDGAVLIDSAYSHQLPDLLAFLKKNKVHKADLRLILNTHFHGDHMAANSDLVRIYHCLVAASLIDAPALEDGALHHRLASPPPTPDRPATPVPPDMRTSPVHIRFSAPFMVSLGDGVLIEAVPLPGHTAGSYGFYEHSTQTLVIGDAVLAMVMAGFHVLDDAGLYHQSLAFLRGFVSQRPVRQVISAHERAMTSAEFVGLLDQSVEFSHRVAAAVREASPHGDLTHVAQSISERMGKSYGPSSLKVAHAYMTAAAHPDTSK